MIKGFNHTGIVVTDLDRMVRFYTQQIGLKILLEIDSVAPPEGDHTGLPGAQRKLVFVGLDEDHRIELIHYLEPASTDGHADRHQLGSMHVCFDVSDLRETCERLKTQGVRFLTEPKFREHDGRKLGVVYAQDPEGNWLEFIEGFSM